MYKQFLILLIALVAKSAEANGTTDAVCTYAPSQSVIVNRISTGVGGAGLGAAAILQAAGLSAVMHSSGAYIFTGAGGYVAGTLGMAIVAPVLITTSVVVGGSVIALELTCAPKNHPDSLRKMKEITAEFTKETLQLNEKAIVIRDNAAKNVRVMNDNAIDVRDASVKKVRAANESAIDLRDRAAQFLSRGVF